MLGSYDEIRLGSSLVFITLENFTYNFHNYQQETLVIMVAGGIFL